MNYSEMKYTAVYIRIPTIYAVLWRVLIVRVDML